MINETTNFSSAVTVKNEQNIDIQVMYLNASLDGGSMNFNISAQMSNKALAQANAAEVKTQYEEFVTAVTARAIELGYPIF